MNILAHFVTTDVFDSLQILFQNRRNSWFCLTEIVVRCRSKTAVRTGNFLGLNRETNSHFYVLG